MGLLTAAITLIAVGTVGPLALVLLFLLFAFAFGGMHGSGSQTALMGGVGLLGISCTVLGLGALLGQILCFFTPLSQDTKMKLGVCLTCGLLTFIPFLGVILALVSLIAYLLFLYGLCADLRASHLTASFNSAAMMGLVAILAWFGSLVAAFALGPVAMVGLLGAFLFGIFSFARYVQTIISLAVHANGLRLAGTVLGPSGPSEFSSFESSSSPAPIGAVAQAPSPPKPAFRLENQDRIQLSPELSGIHEAVRVGDGEKVAGMMRSQGIEAKGPNGLTPLHVAAISGVMQVADFLLKRGAAIDATCDGGLTALYFALQNNNSNLIGLLLSRGASLSHQDDFGRTPLHWACAVPSARLEGQARLRLVQMLLSKGADRNAQDHQGKTPMQLAEEAGHDELTIL